MWQILSLPLIWLFGFVCIVIIKRIFSVSFTNCFLLYVWHTLFALIYVKYVRIYGGDALMYFEVAGEANFDIGTGSLSVIYLTFFLRHGLELSFLGCSLVFNIIGAIGLVVLKGALSKATLDSGLLAKRLASGVVYLPSISYWSSGLGKDAISFLAVTLSVWAAMKRCFGLMVLAVLLMASVRPHIAAIMVIALLIQILCNRRVKLVLKLTISVFLLVVSLLLVPFALKYAGVEDASKLSNLIEYIQHRQTVNMYGNGAINISEMSLPMQLFTYMFRPMVIEATSISALAAGFDNFILLVIVVLGVFGFITKSNRQHVKPEWLGYLWIYLWGCWLILATTSANLGISLRQKWMFAPVLLYLLMGYIGFGKTKCESLSNILTIKIPFADRWRNIIKKIIYKNYKT